MPLARLAAATVDASAAANEASIHGKASQASMPPALTSDISSGQVTMQDNATTPAPAQRQLRQTRSQTRHSDTALLDPTDVKDPKAAEVSHDNDDEDVDILGMSSPSSAGTVDITGSPAIAISAILHAALPVELHHKVSCCR